MAEFISLYSGSSGNSSVVRCGSRYLIVDMGKGVRTTSAALKALVQKSQGGRFGAQGAGPCRQRLRRHSGHS